MSLKGNIVWDKLILHAFYSMDAKSSLIMNEEYYLRNDIQYFPYYNVLYN